MPGCAFDAVDRQESLVRNRSIMPLKAAATRCAGRPAVTTGARRSADNCRLECSRRRDQAGQIPQAAEPEKSAQPRSEPV